MPTPNTDTNRPSLDPVTLAESQMNLWWEYMSLWQGSMMRLMGAQAMPVAVPAKGDKRFKHEDWHEHFLFDYIKQSYLITARWMHDQVASVEGLDEQTKKKVDFFTRQYIDALAPSNFALTNHEVFRETIRRSDDGFRRAQNQIGLLLANHVVSAVDALISSRLAAVAGRPAELHTTLGARGARLSVSIRF